MSWQKAEAAAFLRDGHRKQGFALLADFGAFCHKTKPVEIHVGATRMAT